MTRPRTDAHRRAIIQRARTLLDALGTAPDTVSHLRARIRLEVDDGLAGTGYDGDRGSSGTDSAPERIAIRHAGRRAQADVDLDDLDDALHALDTAELILARLRDRYPAPPDRPASQLRPGVDECPAGHCESCWAAGVAVKASRGEYRDRCRPCGRFRSRTGRDRTIAEIRRATDDPGERDRPPRRSDGHGAVTTGGTA